MSKSEKLVKRFKTVPSDFTWNEFVKIMSLHGYLVSNAKGGSGRKFVNKSASLSMVFHEPHPEKVMKRCYIREVIQHFNDNKVWLEDE
ncbi:HicA protein [Psychrobacter sp. PAMC 21119]|uniref:HicA protein n=1 Tax=Psychrobacter sp. PAMC 21119 TaxID=1112209 RepID=UPI0002899FFE|nr:HicA protein [Psychrobacter sp. PAMC 21119]